MRSIGPHKVGLPKYLFLFMLICCCSAFGRTSHVRAASEQQASAGAPLFERGLYRGAADCPIFSCSQKSAPAHGTFGGYRLKGLIVGGYVNREHQNYSPNKPPLGNNSLVLYGGFLEGSAHGAFGEGPASAEGNSLLLDDRQAFITGSPPPFPAVVTGGMAQEVRYNTLVIRSGTVMGDAAGAYGQNAALGNVISLEGGNVEGAVLGGGSFAGPSSSNTVFMSGGTAREVIGGACAQTGAASNNIVFFWGGRSGGITGGRSEKSHASGNVVHISGGSITSLQGDNSPARVFGGRSLTASATNNNISLSGDLDVRGCIFYGGGTGQDVDAPSSHDVISGNTLTLEEDYRGILPAVRNLESLTIESAATDIPPGLHLLPASLKRVVLDGTLLFTGRQPGLLRFSETVFVGKDGWLEIRLHAGKQLLADTIVFDRGALVLNPIQIKLANPQDLVPDIPVLVMEIDQASTMSEINRRHALVWAIKPELEDEEAEKYEIRFILELGGDDKDHWLVEKRLLPARLPQQ